MALITVSSSQLDLAVDAWFKAGEDGIPNGRDPQDWMRDRMYRAFHAAGVVPAVDLVRAATTGVSGG